MALVDAQPVRHGWLGRFLADPDTELDEFLSGHAAIDGYAAAETPDAARMLFGALSTNDPALKALDAALLKWLDEHRVAGVPAGGPPRLNRRLREIADAIVIVRDLGLAKSAADLRTRYALWTSWAERLTALDGADVRREFLTTLARTQQVVAVNRSDLNPLALEPLWLSVCEQAGGLYPRDYLSVGSLGLRSLPERKGARNELPWITGLARWATAQRPSVAEFEQEWQALRFLYRVTPRIYWQEALRELFAQEWTAAIPGDVAACWRSSVGLREDAEPQRSRPRPTPLSIQELGTFIERIAAEPFATAEPRVRNLVARYERHAQALGDGYFLVRTACKVGMQLIDDKRRGDIADRGALAVELARKALAWEPANVYGWALWRDGLAAQGNYAAAEEIGGYTIARFPHNPQWRTQLALLLATLPGREKDAEDLLRETIDRFPDNPVAQAQLAELLLPGRISEAEDVVDAAFVSRLEDAGLFDLKARLVFHRAGPDPALRILMEATQLFPNNLILRLHRQMLEQGKSIPLVSEKTRAFTAHEAGAERQPAADDATRAITRGGAARRLAQTLFLKRDQPAPAQALSEVKRILNEDPNFAFGRYLEAEADGGRLGADASTVGSFSLAFVDAMLRKDASRLEGLRATASGQSALIDVAQAFIFQDTAAAARAMAWLATRAVAETAPIAALRGFLTLRLPHKGTESSDPASFVAWIANNDNIRLDLMESALAPTELLLAA